MKYTHEFCHAVETKLPREVIEAMAKHGWNAVGVYEMVAEQRRKHRKWKLPVFVGDLPVRVQPGREEQ